VGHTRGERRPSSCIDTSTKAGAFAYNVLTAKSGDKLSLMCTAAKRCTISGVRLVVPENVEAKMD